MRILLIAGGWSTEREVSLRGADIIAVSLARLGHEVVRHDPATDFSNFVHDAKQCDFAFFNLHGEPGEDGLFQAILETIKIPYQGTAPAGSFLALHKAASKLIFEANNIPTPQWTFLTQRPAKDWSPPFAGPWILKPNTGGSSLHMALVEERTTLHETLSTVFTHCNEVLVEELLHGVELTCSVLDETPLPLILIDPQNANGFFDYDSKYQPGAAKEICPAPVSDSITKRTQQLALAAHKALGLAGCSRSDFILVGEDLFLLEVNTLPGMTATSLLPQAAQAAGYSFDELITKLITLGLSRNL
ncbi:D-alanine--D-alanine ligase family protein [Desulfovibrio inopinatus]|uniref:D-alanine--D-alanine ligase family protein n=1 Tax=Desulfovibrio inopinatus TaxID=102109 RepID=UPI00040765FF|nr:D-alanine--D-alanine ligase [Desulfovibrio inopinatus]